MNKKLITLTLILTSTILLVGCTNNTQTTESSFSSSSTTKTSSTSSASSTADSTLSSSTTSKISEGTLTYTDGSKIYVSDEGEFTVTLTDNTKISRSADGTYAINKADGTTIAKEANGTYALTFTSSGLTVSYNAEDDSYVITETSGVETGNGRAKLNTYLSNHGYSTLDTYDKQVQDIVDYISKNQ